MKKLLFLGLIGAAAFALNLQVSKTYQCVTTGMSIKNGKQSRDIQNSIKNEAVLKKALGDIYSVKIDVKDKELNMTANGKSEILAYKGKWKGYDQYVSSSGALVFMPDNTKGTDDAVLIIVPNNIFVYYSCK